MVGQATGGGQAGAQTHRSPQHPVVGAAGASLRHRDCPTPPHPAKASKGHQGHSRMQQRRAGTHRVCILNWVLLVVLPGIPWVAQLQPSREGACLAPSLQVGWGRGPYQREVVMAGVVAGVLAFWAEALRAQRQAGPPAPAQAKPGGGGNRSVDGRGHTHTIPKGQLGPSLLQGRG